ncbi:MAG: hypothetical protein Q4E55_00315 [Bacteroidales bacterium]|nr:hypothetical protein [Bacteroidales bacterium]
MRNEIVLVISIIVLQASCARKPATFSEVNEYPDIYPDYVGVTVPAQMAPLNFIMADGRKMEVVRSAQADTLWVTVKAWQKGAEQGVAYKPFPIYISHDRIDPYLAYRLIEPGYEGWRYMGIYQRELSSFEETPIVTNEANNHGCVNCHTFLNREASRMLFHSRGPGGGTVFVEGDAHRLVNIATLGAKKQGTYPAWHPYGRYVAFSSNDTHQCFPVKGEQPVEVFDTRSDIILMDLQTDSVAAHPPLNTGDTWETFPTWSADGKTLYYCAADSVGQMPLSRGRLHYKLMAIDFDADKGCFEGEPRLIYGNDSLSVSFPRVTPDGRFLCFTRTRFGTFPVWHREADLWMMNLGSGEVYEANDINSNDTESYHSWSSNGRWMVFGSRRLDGRYTRLFITHFDGEGRFSKPFLLPQQEAVHNQLRLKSYNIPEFVKGRVKTIEKI